MYDEVFNGRIFVPPNIKNNKQAIVGKFDLRDVIYIGLAGGLFSIVCFPLIKLGIDVGFSVLLGLILAIPIIICCFKKFDGLKFEEYVFVYKANKINASPVRVNNSDNLYEILENTKTKTNQTNSDENVNLNPLAKIIFDLTTKNQKDNKIGNVKIKNQVKVEKKQEKNQVKKKVKDKSQQIFIYNTIKTLCFNGNYMSIDDLLNDLENKGIVSEYFIKGGQRKISFKTDKIKHFVSGEHINKNLKYDNLRKIINDIRDYKDTHKNLKNIQRVFFVNGNRSVVKKNNTKKGMVVYK